MNLVTVIHEGSVWRQAASLGLGEQWDKVKFAYAAANRALGDIVKVCTFLIHTGFTTSCTPKWLLSHTIESTLFCHSSLKWHVDAYALP